MVFANIWVAIFELKLKWTHTSFEADPSWKILLREEINMMLCDRLSKTTKLLKSEWETNS